MSTLTCASRSFAQPVLGKRARLLARPDAVHKMLTLDPLVAFIRARARVLRRESLTALRDGVEKPVKALNLMKVPNRILSPITTPDHANTSCCLTVHTLRLPLASLTELLSLHVRDHARIDSSETREQNPADL